MNHYETERGLELVPVSDNDRETLLLLKQRFPDATFFTYDIQEGQAGLVIVEEEP